MKLRSFFLCAMMLVSLSVARADDAGKARHLRNAGIVTVALGVAATIAGLAAIGYYTHSGCGDGQDNCLAAIPMGGVIAGGVGAIVTGIPMWVVGQRRIDRAPRVAVSPTGVQVRF